MHTPEHSTEHPAELLAALTVPEYIPLKQAADALGSRRPDVLGLIADGELRAVRFGHLLLVC